MASIRSFKAFGNENSRSYYLMLSPEGGLEVPIPPKGPVPPKMPPSWVPGLLNRKESPP